MTRARIVFLLGSIFDVAWWGRRNGRDRRHRCEAWSPPGFQASLRDAVRSWRCDQPVNWRATINGPSGTNASNADWSILSQQFVLLQRLSATRPVGTPEIYGTAGSIVCDG